MNPKEYRWLSTSEEEASSAENEFCDYDEDHDLKDFRLSLLSALIGINKAMVDIRDELRKMNEKEGK